MMSVFFSGLFLFFHLHAILSDSITLEHPEVIISKDKIVISCVGDSITAGHHALGVTKMNRNMNMTTALPKRHNHQINCSNSNYPKELQNKLGDKYEVLNFGIGISILVNT